MFEFTGERLVPGLVDINLYHEHLSRYLFATEYALGKRVLDAGCGTGYGAAELARMASSVLAIDVSTDAIEYARQNYTGPNLRFEAGSCAAIPSGDASFELITAFEVIEHLEDWQLFLRECSRVLAKGGVLLVSTPNRSYYAETREAIGPNPFHVREFDFNEYGEELRRVFNDVEILFQNHAEGIVFSAGDVRANPRVHLESGESDPHAAHFFLAICAREPRPAAAPFVYVPGSANILREREHHIAKLTGEIRRKSDWLERSQVELNAMIAKFGALQSELEERNRWARERHRESEERGARVVNLQEELAAVSRGYEQKVAELEQENRDKTEWARDIELRLEATVAERTEWALRLQSEADALRRQLDSVRASRWHRLGRKLKLGPDAG